MADRLWRAQVSIPMDTALPEDAIVNTWHFDDDDDPIAAPDDTRDWIMQALTGFYQTIDNVLLAASVTSPATVRLYDMADPTPRQPLFTEQIALTPVNGDDGLPSEVALCLSFSAAVSSGQNAARRRGRLYLGPIATAAITTEGGARRPSAAVRTVIANAAAVVRNGIEHPGSPGLHLKWAIYSPTTDATDTLANAFNDVATGWIDDAFDTQRRRGARPTTRTTF